MQKPLTLRSVAEAGYTSDIALIERAAADTSPEIRRAALGSFHRSKRLTHIEVLNALRDPAMTVRRRAAELSPRPAIKGRARSEVLVQLGVCLGQESEVAEMAAFAIGEIGSQTTDESQETMLGIEQATLDLLIDQAQHHADAICREQAVASLGAMHTGKDVILGALKDKATVRRRAVIALAPFEGDDIDAALHAALEDRDWQVRQAAEDLLGPDQLNADQLDAD